METSSILEYTVGCPNQLKIAPKPLWILKTVDNSYKEREHGQREKARKKVFYMHYQNWPVERARDHAMYTSRYTQNSLLLPLVANSGNTCENRFFFPFNIFYVFRKWIGKSWILWIRKGEKLILKALPSSMDISLTFIFQKQVLMCNGAFSGSESPAPQ